VGRIDQFGKRKESLDGGGCGEEEVWLEGKFGRKKSLLNLKLFRRSYTDC
jgi:hypothetical protein